MSEKPIDDLIESMKQADPYELGMVYMPPSKPWNNTPPPFRCYVCKRCGFGAAFMETITGCDNCGSYNIRRKEIKC